MHSQGFSLVSSNTVSNFSFQETRKLQALCLRSGGEGAKRTTEFMSYSMLTSTESSEAGTTSVHIAWLAITLACRFHSVVSGRGLDCPRKGGCASHFIYCCSTCKVA